VNRRVSFRPDAEAEALETRDWYEGRRPGLGAEFRAALDEAIERIADNPMQFRLVRAETWRAILNRFSLRCVLLRRRQRHRCPGGPRLTAPSAMAIASVIARHIMKAPRIQAVEMTRKIRDRHARRLAGKTPRAAPAVSGGVRACGGIPRSRKLRRIAVIVSSAARPNRTAGATLAAIPGDNQHHM
jgi:hypothetical protein